MGQIIKSVCICQCVSRVPVSWRPGVPDARKSRWDAEFWHAWRPVDAEKWIVRRHWTPKKCYLGVLTNYTLYTRTEIITYMKRRLNFVKMSNCLRQSQCQTVSLWFKPRNSALGDSEY